MRLKYETKIAKKMTPIFKPKHKKKIINWNNINSFNAFYNLKNKTQMIRNVKRKGQKTFFTRMKHTLLVMKVAKAIYSAKDLKNKGVNLERLEYSALLHDVGHTPYGHAGEEAINELFFTDNDNYYSKIEAGTFKHNMHSIRRIGEYFFIDYKNGDHILVDSILKHGPTLPKKYNFELFPEEDILRQNRLLELTFLRSGSKMTDNFVKEFLRKANTCKNITVVPVINKNICHHCNKKNLCLYHTDISKYSSSLYLTYRYPLTCEGTVLYWSDEIACLCGDLFDLLLLLKMYSEKSNDKPIFLLDLKARLHLIQAKYINNVFIEKILECISFVEDRKMSYTSFRERVRKRLISLEAKDSLLRLLIDSLQLDNVIDNEIHLNFNNGECDYLFKMKDDFNDIFKTVKNIIYSEAHNLPYVKKVNEVGKNRIKQLAKMFYGNLNLFMREYSKNSGSIGKRVYSIISGSLYSIYGIKKSTISKNKFNEEFEIEFSDINNVIAMTIESLKKSKSLGRFLANETVEKKTIQLFSREILHFIASLPEDVIDNYFKKKKYKLTHLECAKMPTDYLENNCCC